MPATAGQLVPSAPIFSSAVMRPSASVMRSSSDSEALQKGSRAKAGETHGLIRRGISGGGGCGRPEQLTAKTDNRQLPPHVSLGQFQHCMSQPLPCCAPGRNALPQ